MVHTTRILYRFRDSAFTSGFQLGESVRTSILSASKTRQGKWFKVAEGTERWRSQTVRAACALHELDFASAAGISGKPSRRYLEEASAADGSENHKLHFRDGNCDYEY